MFFAEYGYQLLKKKNVDPLIKKCGLSNVVVWGRAVTNVLQKLKHLDPSFSEWYEPYVKELKGEPLFKYFYDSRSKILKEGKLSLDEGLSIKKMNFPEDLKRFPRPPNAGNLVMCASGVWWEIHLQDGSVGKFYVDLPSDMGEIDWRFSECPKKYKEIDISTFGIEELARIFLDYLGKMVEDALKKFGK